MGVSPWAIAQIWRGRPALVVLGLDLAAAGLDLGSHGPRRRWSRALLGKKQWAGSVKMEGVNAGEPSQERKARSPPCSSEAVAGSAAMQESYDSELGGGLKDLAGCQQRGRDEGDSGRRNSRRRRWPRSCTSTSAMVVAAAKQR